MKQRYKRNGSSAIVAWLAIPLAMVLCAAGIIGVVHHHSGGTVDAACAICSASVAPATTVPVVAAPAGPELRLGTVALPAETQLASAAVHRASSRAPPIA